MNLETIDSIDVDYMLYALEDISSNVDSLFNIYQLSTNINLTDADKQILTIGLESLSDRLGFDVKLPAMSNLIRFSIEGLKQIILTMRKIWLTISDWIMDQWLKFRLSINDYDYEIKDLKTKIRSAKLRTKRVDEVVDKDVFASFFHGGKSAYKNAITIVDAEISSMDLAIQSLNLFMNLYDDLLQQAKKLQEIVKEKVLPKEKQYLTVNIVDTAVSNISKTISKYGNIKAEDILGDTVESNITSSNSYTNNSLPVLTKDEMLGLLEKSSQLSNSIQKLINFKAEIRKIFSAVYSIIGILSNVVDNLRERKKVDAELNSIKDAFLLIQKNANRASKIFSNMYRKKPFEAMRILDDSITYIDLSLRCY
jgi:hypothetical protein